MAKVEITGLDEWIKKLEKAGKNPTGQVKRSLWVAAGEMASAIKSAVGSLPTDEEFGTKRHPKNGPTASERAGLVSGLGISRMKNSGETVDVVIGFNGTNADGVKNTTVMRRVESGTSVMKKHPVIRQTANRTKEKAMAAAKKQFEHDVKELLG